MRLDRVMALACVSGLALLSGEVAMACGGGGGGNAGGSQNQPGTVGLTAGLTGGGTSLANLAGFSPAAGAVSQVNLARQSATAQANAYNARMRPIRIANAQKAREQKLARREAFKQTMLARAETRKKAEQEFLAKARTWVDSTGQHKLVAVMTNANSWGVQLKKRDGSSVNVPMDRLSSPDQVYLASLRSEPTIETMLAGL